MVCYFAYKKEIYHHSSVERLFHFTFLLWILWLLIKIIIITFQLKNYKKFYLLLNIKFFYCVLYFYSSFFFLTFEAYPSPTRFFFTISPLFRHLVSYIFPLQWLLPLHTYYFFFLPPDFLLFEYYMCCLFARCGFLLTGRKTWSFFESKMIDIILIFLIALCVTPTWLR